MKLKSALDYQQGRIAALDLVKNDNGQITLMAFDQGTVITSHKAPGDALVQVLEGSMAFVVDGERRELEGGDYFTMSAGTVHEVYAVDKSKVLLVIIKTDACGCGSKNKEAEELLPEN